MTLQIRAFGTSDIGLVRETNEDAWLILEKLPCYLLADGIGGHLAGEIASKEAIEFVSDFLTRHLLEYTSYTCEDVMREVRRAIIGANRHIYQMSLGNAYMAGMGTTLCCLFFCDTHVVYAHVGDSRIYHLQHKALTQLTQDHSLAIARTLSEKNRWGNGNEIESSALRHMLTRSIGVSSVVRPAIAVSPIQSGDFFLVSSDGLHGTITQPEIEKVLNEDGSLENIAYKLVGMALKRGGQDNISLIVVSVED